VVIRPAARGPTRRWPAAEDRARGQGSEQGVGLPGGPAPWLLVEAGRKRIGQRLPSPWTGALQASDRRMVFARCDQDVPRRVAVVSATAGPR